jgi:hypothetical protein
MAGAWFYDLEYARTMARSWEMLVPFEFDPQTVRDDNHVEKNPQADPPKAA